MAKPKSLLPDNIQQLMAGFPTIREKDILPYDPNRQIPKAQWELDLEKIDAEDDRKRKEFFAKNPNADEWDYFEFLDRTEPKQGGHNWCGFGRER